MVGLPSADELDIASVWGHVIYMGRPTASALAEIELQSGDGSDMITIVV